MITLFTAAQSRAADAHAMTQCGVSGFELMLRAGEFAWDTLLERWPNLTKLTVLTGKGNNAGDGYVLARRAAQFGVQLQLLQVGAAPTAGDGAQAVAWAEQAGVKALRYEEQAFTGDVLVDALLGTGAQGTLREPIRGAVRALRSAPQPVLALDLPTGLRADSGGPCDRADEVVQAAATASFITHKIGQHTGLGKAACGALCFSDLGVGSVIDPTGVPLHRRPLRRAALPVTSHKYQRGFVLLVGGDQAMGGAALLAGEAALRSGAGLGVLATRPEHRQAVLARRPELMVLDAEDEAAVARAAAKASAVVIGPGLGRNAWSQARLVQVAQVASRGVPIIADADALHLLADGAALRPAIVTPHSGEAARLLGISSAEIEADRPAAAQRIAEQYDTVCVLKGPGSIIACAQAWCVCGAGNPAMASGGMGDVLAGVCGALLANGLAPYDAATAATVLHSFAADQALRDGATYGLLASDLLPYLGRSYAV